MNKQRDGKRSSSAPRSMQSPIKYTAEREYLPDTCEPLKQAARNGRVQLVAMGQGSYPGLPLDNQDLLAVRSFGYWDAPQAQTWGLGWHRNEGIEFSMLARGSLTFSVDESNYHLRSRHLTITRPWQTHKVGDPHIGASRLYWLILDVGVRLLPERVD
jgi:AraC family L-rhamnose operon regulatory protein RhaS